MEKFNIGDTVKKYNKNDNKWDDFEYIIVNITYKKGGNFHDGYTITKCALLSDSSIHELSFDNNMANIHIRFNNLIKIE